MTTTAPEAPTTDDTWPTIRVSAPLPLGMAETIMRLIGTAWPDAVIDTRATQFGDAFAMRVPPTIAGRVSKKAVRGVVKDVAAAYDDENGDLSADLVKMDETGVSLAPPEDLCLLLGEIARTILSAHEPAAVNFVEWTVRAPATEDRPEEEFVLCAARSKGQTPSALLIEANGEVERCHELMAEHMPSDVEWR